MFTEDRETVRFRAAKGVSWQAGVEVGEGLLGGGYEELPMTVSRPVVCPGVRAAVERV